ncbi:MAG: carbohydrate ABC transporter permease [Christensenellales bacterium]
MQSSLKKNRKRKGLNEGRFLLFMLLPGLLLVALFTYYPAMRGVTMAFQKHTIYNLKNITWNGLDNFRAIFRDREFLLAIPNTLKWVFISLFSQFVIGFALALFLKRSFRGRGIYQGAICFPWAISGFLIGITFKWIYNGSYGPINDILIKLGFVERANPIGFLSDPKIALYSVIVANIWYGIPFFVIMIQAALQGVPDDLYEAADIDGASIVQKFFHITIPCIKSVLILTTLLRVIWIFNSAELIYALTDGNPAGRTHTITSKMLNLIMSKGNYGEAGAVGIIIIGVLTMFATFYIAATKFEQEDGE